MNSTQSSISNFTTSQILLSISVNFRRICHSLLTVDPSLSQKRVRSLLADTKQYIEKLNNAKTSSLLTSTIHKFLSEKIKLIDSVATPEEYLTWSSILRSRAMMISDKK